MHANGNILVSDEGEPLGVFSSHWAACAAMLRLGNPDFVSLGGDAVQDLAVESVIRERLNACAV